MGKSAGGNSELLAVEKHGIDIVSPSERRGKPRDLFWMWLGANLNVFYVVNGAVVISIGLSFVQAIVAIVLANLAFLFVGMASLQGPRTGTSTFAVSRAAYGPRGGKGLSVFNWLTCVGFEASGLALIVLAVLEILHKAGLGNSVGVKIVVILAAAVVQSFLPVLGHATIVRIQRYLAWGLIPFFILMAVLIAPKVQLHSINATGSWSDISIAVALLISAGGLSWANTGSDYSRYLPSNSNVSAVFWYPSLGGFLPAVLLEILGAAVASVVATASDPIAGIPHALPGWVVVPYLVFATVTLLSVNTLDLYSSSLTLQALGVKLARWGCVLVDLVICTVLTFIVIFSSQFNHYYSDFLSLLIVWLAPWTAIYLIDSWMRRGRYDAQSLFKTAGGLYWRSGGLHVPGIVAQVAGMVAACLWLDSPAFLGPLSTRTHGSDFSVFLGVGVAGLLYFVLARRTVREEAGMAAEQATVEFDLAPSMAQVPIDAES